jgi:glutaredoxin 3
MDRVTKLASQHAVVVFSKSSCCMSYTVMRLFTELGVNPMHELDQDQRRKDMERALVRLLGDGGNNPVPAVFIGGKLVGSTDKAMALHMSGCLAPLLRNAGALRL